MNTEVSRVERAFNLEHYFASESFAAVLETCSSMCPDKEVPNETAMRRLVTTF
jgi:hypothetical protein